MDSQDARSATKFESSGVRGPVGEPPRPSSNRAPDTSAAIKQLPIIAPHDWKLAPKSLFSTYICRACGMASMVKHHGRCSGGS